MSPIFHRLHGNMQMEERLRLDRLDNAPTIEAGYQEKIATLERQVGQLTMEMDLLKKALQQAHSQQKKSASIYPLNFPNSEVSNGGAES